MQFYNYDNNEFVTLEKVAEAIAPLLRPLLQPAPAPADVPSANARIAALETALDSVCEERDWFMAQLAEAKQVQHTDARLLAADKRREVAERQLADARQEIEQLREDKLKHAAVLGAVMRQRDELRTERDEYRSKWQAIPWGGIERVVGVLRYGYPIIVPPEPERLLIAWYDANRPAAAAQD